MCPIRRLRLDLVKVKGTSSSVAGRVIRSDIAKVREQMVPIAAIGAVGPVERGHPIEMLIDRLRHLASQDGQSPTGRDPG